MNEHEKKKKNAFILEILHRFCHVMYPWNDFPVQIVKILRLRKRDDINELAVTPS